jgi:hypothetical protein
MNHWGNILSGKACVRAVDYPFQVAAGDIIDEPRHNLEGQFGVAQFLPGIEGFTADSWNRAGEEQATIFS